MRSFLSFFLALVFAFLPRLVVAQGMPAPASIDNQARSVYVSDLTGQDGLLISNQVQAALRFETPFSVSKSALTPSPTQETLLSYRIDATRHVAGIAYPTAITVDNVAKAFFLVADDLPTGTVFQTADATDGGQLLFHLRGSAESAYTATLPSELAKIDRVVAAYGTFPAGDTRTLNISLLNSNTTGTVVNVGAVQFVNKDLVPDRISSNAANIVIGKKTAEIRYLESSYTKVLESSLLGMPLYIEVTWPAGNLDPNAVDRGTITLTSSMTGDQETFEIVETGPDTGIFRVVAPIPTRSAYSSAPTSKNSIMETLEGDKILARIDVDGGKTVETEIRIESVGGGIVFDSKTGQPISGAKVTLINNATGLPATVFDFDGSTRLDSWVITGDDGRYMFPVLAAGSYRIQVEPPPGYTFTSKVVPDKLPKGRKVDTNGSYAYPFQRNGSEKLWFDIPCDPVGGNVGLFVDKTAARSSVEIGETLGYEVRVRNVSGEDLSSVVIEDKLPFGFRYIKGSARVDGKRIDDPATSDATMEFNIGKVKKDETVALTYRVRVTVGAKEGDGINRASAHDTRKRNIKSNRAEFFVEVVPGVFTDNGIIIGKIYVDLNRNKIQDDGEPGIPGVRLYLEDGSYAITDNEGKYSFYGITPRLHVVKVDNTTLPPGSKLEVLSNRNAGDPGSRFVDLTKGEMHKADFAEASGNPAVLENVMRRRAATEDGLTEIESNLQVPLTRDASMSATATVSSALGDAGSLGGNTLGVAPTSRTVQDLKSLPASGIIGVGAVPYVKGAEGGTGQLGLTNAAEDAAMPRREIAPNTPWKGSLVGTGSGAGFTTAARPPGYHGMDSVPPQNPVDVLTKQVLPPSTPLEAAILAVAQDEPVGFLDFVDGDTLSMAQATIRVRGTASAALSLSVNGVPVPASRIGKQVTLSSPPVQGVEYVGVAFTPGPNTLELTQRDPFGNIRGQKTITVVAPGHLGQILLEFPTEARADGRTAVKVVVRLVDAKGIPVSARTPVTLETNVSEWDVKDLNPKEPGVQVFLEGGKGEFYLKAPLEPCDAIIRVSTGSMKKEAQVSFLPELRPLIAAGLVEGRVDFSSLNSTFGRREQRDAFTSQLQHFSTTNGEDGPEAAARTAFFIKGQVVGEYVLTASYDSEKDSHQRLFRDIQPDEFYPIYGDSSLKGFDAQSTSSVYAKIENKKSYLLYGDYVTQSNSDLRSLGNYNRSLTGAQYHFENKWLSANAWGSYDNTRQVIEELPANGTSGPFAFRIANGLVNSEKVEILTRDRNQPAVIINTVAMTRFTDYQFEPFSGRILFKSPIPSVDENLNPISIRITYEADQGGDRFWAYGADAQVRATDWLEIGGSAVDDRNPFAPYRLYSGNSALRVEKNTFLIGEVAVSDSPFDGGSGHAERLELRHQSESLIARLYWSRADENFRNPSSTLTAGRVEAGAQVGYRVNQKLSLRMEAIDTESVSGGTRRGVLAEAGYLFTDRIRLDIGGRYSTESGDPYATSATAPAITNGSEAEPVGKADIASIRAKLSVPFPYLENGSLYGEYENDLIDIERRVASTGFEYQANKETKIYAKHEFISSLDGQFDLNNFQQKNSTVIGVQTAYMQGGQMFNEYRVRDAIDGRQSEGAIGLRNNYTVFEGLQVQGTFERIAPMVIGRKSKQKREEGTLLAPERVGSETTAVTAAFDYSAPENWKMTGRGEFRTSDTEDAWLFTLGYASRLNENNSVLGRIIYDEVISKGEDGGNRQQFRLQLGYAYRPVRVNFWNFLSKYELKIQNDGILVDYASRRVVHIVSADVNWQPLSRLTVSGHYAAKVAFESGLGQNDTEFANLIGARVLLDLTDRLDAGLNARLMVDNHGRFQYGLGPELGFRLQKNMRIATGYNFFGFRDRDFSADNYTQKGVYFAFNMKFDENLFHFGRGEE